MPVLYLDWLKAASKMITASSSSDCSGHGVLFAASHDLFYFLGPKESERVLFAPEAVLLSFRFLFNAFTLSH